MTFLVFLKVCAAVSVMLITAVVLIVVDRDRR